MSKIRKGSIVWDDKTRQFTKVLNSVSKGEVPDSLFLKTGKANHSALKGIALLYDNSAHPRMTCNNAPCYMKRVDHLLTRKQYLEYKKELLIKSN